MKYKKTHIALAFLLLFNLFFTQIVANFLHDEHCERIESAHHNHDEASGETISEDHEDCTICSLDLFHEFFYNPISGFDLYLQFVTLQINNLVLPDKAMPISLPGRSPPAC